MGETQVLAPQSPQLTLTLAVMGAAVSLPGFRSPLVC